MIILKPELLELVQESSNRTMESTMRMMGASEEQIVLAIEEANEKQDINQMNLVGLSDNVEGSAVVSKGVAM
jgi:hypothetical protein